MVENTYPFNLIRKIYGESKNENKHVYTTYVKGLLEQLKALTKREQQVIELRYIKQLTQKECGEQLGVSGSRIMQIEHKALRKLRHHTRKKHYEAVPQIAFTVLSKEYETLSEENNVLKSVIRKLINGDMQPENLVPIEATNTQNGISGTPIHELGLTTRAYNALTRSGVNTLGDISNLTEKDFNKIRNLGEKTKQEIIFMLKHYDLKLQTAEHTKAATSNDLKSFVNNGFYTKKVTIDLDDTTSKTIDNLIQKYL